MKPFAIAFLMIPMLGGCAQIAKISDEKLAEDLYIGAKLAIQYGIKLAIQKSNPESAKTIIADVKIGNSIVKGEILPLFKGASTAVLLRNALDLALANLWSKIKPELREAVQLSLSILLTNIELPRNPADQIDERTKKALVGLFTGISEGADAAVALATPAADTGFKIDK
jgi:hypothetical protein